MGITCSPRPSTLASATCALVQPRAGTVRHDAVAWGYARAADRRGVDIIQGCDVTAIRRSSGGQVTGVDTSRGAIDAPVSALCCAGNSSRVAALAGLRLPIETHVLQAFVTEGIKPFLNTVVSFGAGHFYISQSNAAACRSSSASPNAPWL